MSTLMTHGESCDAGYADDQELTDDELRRFEIKSEQAYRTMCGLDEPLERRAERAKLNARRTRLSAKSW